MDWEHRAECGSVGLLPLGDPGGEQVDERRLRVRVHVAAAQPGRAVERAQLHGPDALGLQQVGAVGLLDPGLRAPNLDVGWCRRLGR